MLSDPQKRARYDQFGHEDPTAGGAGLWLGRLLAARASRASAAASADSIFSDVLSAVGATGGYGAARNGPVPGRRPEVRHGADLRGGGQGLHQGSSTSRATRNLSRSATAPARSPAPSRPDLPHLQAAAGQVCGVTQNTMPAVRIRRGASLFTTCHGDGQDRHRSLHRSATAAARCAPVKPRHRQDSRGRGRPASVHHHPTGQGDGRRARRRRRATCRSSSAVRPHKLFKRDGLRPVLRRCPSRCTQAALGAEIDVPTLDKPGHSRPSPRAPSREPRCRITRPGRCPGLRRHRQAATCTSPSTVDVPREAHSRSRRSCCAEFDASMTGKEYEGKKSFFDRMKDAF